MHFSWGKNAWNWTHKSLQNILLIACIYVVQRKIPSDTYYTCKWDAWERQVKKRTICTTKDSLQWQGQPKTDKGQYSVNINKAVKLDSY